MSTTQTPQNFTITSGDSKTLRVSVVDQDGAAVDLTGASAVWAVATSRSTPILLQKATPASITITDGPGGLLEVTLDPADTDSFAGSYYHELQIVDNEGRKSTALTGTLNVRHDLITT